MSESDILVRIKRLERSNRRLGLAFLLAIFALTGIVVLGAAKPDDAKVLRAERFELVNAEGKTFASLYCGDHGGVLGLNSAKNDSTILLNAGSKLAPFIMLTAEGTSRMAILSAGDTPGLALSREKESILLSLKDGPAIQMSDSKGKRRFMVNLTKDAPSVSLYDETRPRLTLGVPDLVRTKDGATEGRPESSLVMFD